VFFLDDKAEVKSLFTNFAKKVQMRSDSREMVVCACLSLVQLFYSLDLDKNWTPQNLNLHVSKKMEKIVRVHKFYVYNPYNFLKPNSRYTNRKKIICE
jgi:hypothetical protein